MAAGWRRRDRGFWPRQRWIMGPSLRVRSDKLWWGMSVRRWRWPMIGSAGGDGGVLAAGDCNHFRHGRSVSNS